MDRDLARRLDDDTRVIRQARDTAAGSSCRSLAIRSSVRSRQKAASGPPAPRYAPVGGLLVMTPRTSTCMAGVVYGPARRWLVRMGTVGVERRKYAPRSATICTR